MAYEIPEYVDTQEQAILAVASAVKGEQVAGGDGSVNTALDVLADALAGENVQVPQTQQGAILALAQYVSGGGGGGGGDASTATVTYTLTGGKSDLYVEAAIAVEDESGKHSYSNYQTEETSGSFTVLLYGGRAFAVIGESIITVVSGDAEADGDMLIITGDCTVTVAPD